MKPIALTLSWMLISVAALAQTYTDANLNGKYAIQYAEPNTDTWSKTFVCPSNSTVSFTATGSTTTMTGFYGVITFNGSGNFSASVTNFGKLNSTASANTMSVTWNSSCQLTSVNNGHVVYVALASQVVPGTYSVKSSGTGSLSATGQKGALTLQLAATDSSGLSTTALLTATQINGSRIGTGIAVRQ